MGKNEELVLLSTLRAQQESGAPPTAATIYKTMEARLEGLRGFRMPAFGAVYTTLSRMADKNWVKVIEKTDDSGRERRHFEVSVEGRAALSRAQNAVSLLNVKGVLAGA